MNPTEMAKDACEALEAGTNMTIVLPKPWSNRPPKFPRGSLLCEQDGSNVYSYDPMKILAWLTANNLINIKTAVVHST
jgi:hypothetical protein